ncbi:MAG TPA: hypothetical protein O0X50_02590 [Methanocorpusculum sp.]|nr:hypothetical protein [Methanocorpusculum sp.]
MALVEIQMNRLGINSIELATRETEVSTGTALHIRVTNYGAPTHVTLKTDGAAYTIFTYENIYLEAEAEVTVPIKSDAPAGSFTVHIISGYGLRKEEFLVNVIKPEELPPQPSPLEEMMAAELEETEEKKHSSSMSLTARKVIVASILPIIALVLILVWIFVFPAWNPVMIVLIVFVIMVAGTAIAWLSAR